MIGMGLFEVNLCFVHEFIIVFPGDLFPARTAQMSHTFPLPRSKRNDSAASFLVNVPKMPRWARLGSARRKPRREYTEPDALPAGAGAQVVLLNPAGGQDSHCPRAPMKSRLERQLKLWQLPEKPAVVPTRNERKVQNSN
jgi:hypothetical protein